MKKDLKKEDSKKYFKKKNIAIKKSLKVNHKVCMSIITSYLQIFDTFHYMNKIINVANKEEIDIWSLEEHYNAIDALFLLCEIKDENHKDILFNLIYRMAFQKIGDKDFEERAEGILAQLKKTIISQSTTLSVAQK